MSQAALESEQTLPGRLLLPAVGAAAWNMALDQALLESVSEAAEKDEPVQPVLRFYLWEQPTLSLGYFQSRQDSSPRFDSIDRVRRSTGGGAILHHHELTYSLTMPTRAGERGARHDLYQGVHECVVAALSKFGVRAKPYRLDVPQSSRDDLFLCFQRRTDVDLIVSGYKILGSAQRRAKRAILQHGSLLLKASVYSAELPGIFDLTSIEMAIPSLVSEIADETKQRMGIQWSEGASTAAERQRAEMIQSERFQSDRWWNRR